MQRKKQTCVLAALLYCVCGVHNNLRADTEEPVDFTVRNVIDGTTFTASDHRGKCMVVIFGSIYCKPCIQMIPVINQLHDTYKDAGLTAVGIDIDFGSE